MATTCCDGVRLRTVGQASVPYFASDSYPLRCDDRVIRKTGQPGGLYTYKKEAVSIGPRDLSIASVSLAILNGCH